MEPNNSEKQLNKSIDELTTVNEKLVKQNGPFPSLIRGLFSGLGSTVGVAIILAIIGYALNRFGAFDFLRPIWDNLRGSR